MVDPDSRRELAIRTAAAVLAGSASLAGTDAGAAATSLSPLIEAGLARICEVLSSRRRVHAAETLMAAADAADASTEEEFLEFIERALSDPRRQELLARALIIAQDSASRDKRRAIGRALAAGTAGDGARVDDELIFIQVLNDLDTAHVRLLAHMNNKIPIGRIAGQRYDAATCTPRSIALADPGLADTAPALLLMLQRHGLVWGTVSFEPPGEHSQEEFRKYIITPYGKWFLKRLAESAHEDPARRV